MGLSLHLKEGIMQKCNNSEIKAQGESTMCGAGIQLLGVNSKVGKSDLGGELWQYT